MVVMLAELTVRILQLVKKGNDGLMVNREGSREDLFSL